MIYSNKTLMAAIGISLSILFVKPTYAYELLDKDGDGITETVRFCDGYEKEALFNYIGVLALDLAEGNYSNGIIHYDWLERDDEICRKYPGELQLVEEYLAKNAVLASEGNMLKQEMLTAIKNSSENWWEQLAMYSRIMDSKLRNIDETAQGFTKPSDIVPEIGSVNWNDHYSEYRKQKEIYTRQVEYNAFLRGEFPLSEMDYHEYIKELYKNDFSYFLPKHHRYSAKSFTYLLIDGEWWNVELYESEDAFPVPTKGISEKGIQNLLEKDVGVVVTNKEGAPPFLENLPVEVQKRVNDFYNQ